MQNGSSEEKDSDEEEAGPQDRGGEKVDGEEDGHCSSQDRQKEIASQGRGACPRAFFIFLPKQLVTKRGRNSSKFARSVVARAIGGAQRCRADLRSASHRSAESPQR
jgi:hypothetical protein